MAVLHARRFPTDTGAEYRAPLGRLLRRPGSARREDALRRLARVALSRSRRYGVHGSGSPPDGFPAAPRHPALLQRRTLHGNRVPRVPPSRGTCSQTSTGELMFSTAANFVLALLEDRDRKSTHLNSSHLG